jgi:hypothetical protein
MKQCSICGSQELTHMCGGTATVPTRGAIDPLNVDPKTESVNYEVYEWPHSIGWAVAQMREGKKVRRAGWNGRGMWLVLMPELKLPPHSSQELGAKVNDRTAKHIGPDTPLDSQPYISMWTAQGQWQPGWLCSQADLLATDWELVE